MLVVKGIIKPEWVGKHRLSLGLIFCLCIVELLEGQTYNRISNIQTLQHFSLTDETLLREKALLICRLSVAALLAAGSGVLLLMSLLVWDHDKPEPAVSQD